MTTHNMQSNVKNIELWPINSMIVIKNLRILFKFQFFHLLQFELH